VSAKGLICTKLNLFLCVGVCCVCGEVKAFRYRAFLGANFQLNTSLLRRKLNVGLLCAMFDG
jgi:hypothetical protein